MDTFINKQGRVNSPFLFMRKFRLIRENGKAILEEITGKIPIREDFGTMAEYMAASKRFSRAYGNKLAVSDKLMFCHQSGDILEEDKDFEIFYETGMEAPVAILPNQIHE